LLFSAVTNFVKETSVAKTATRKKAASAASKSRKPMSRKKAAKRELIDTGRDKRFVRRDGEGKFNESDDVGKSLAQDRRRKAKIVVKSGQGDKGDQKRRKSG
jgi:hypothetical protein